MKTFKLHMIRHGATMGNIEGRYVGITDLPLCEQGRSQLKELLDLYEYPKVQKVYVSPLQRAVQTAELIYPDNLLHKVDELRECDFGRFENRRLGELNDDEKFKAWLDSGMEAAPEGGESREEFLHRLDVGICKIFMDMMKQNISNAALVAHGGVLMALLSKYGMPKQSELEWQVDFGKGYTVMTSAQIWMRDGFFEVFDPLPYDNNDKEPAQYKIIDLDEESE